MVSRNLRYTSVTVVLIGKETANRPWVRYEIKKSIEQDNGLLGIRIHHLKNQHGESDWWQGSTPHVPDHVEFPVYDWDRDLDRFRKASSSFGSRRTISSAAKSSGSSSGTLEPKAKALTSGRPNIG
jgi:hypothetical protein